jgi:hypothetical protein
MTVALCLNVQDFAEQQDDVAGGDELVMQRREKRTIAKGIEARQLGA